MEVFEGCQIILSAEDLSKLIRDGTTEEEKGIKIILKASDLIVKDKDVKPSGTSSFHVYVPAPLGREFETMHIVAAKKKIKNTKEE